MKHVQMGCLASVLALAIVLTGCSALGQLIEPKTTGATVMTPDEAKHDLWGRLDLAQAAIGGTWAEEDSEVANSCADSKGFYYSSVRRQTGPFADPDVPTGKLEELWDSDDDYDVRVNSYGPNHRQLFATAQNGTTMVYGVEDNIMITADGPCIPGDFAAVSDEDVRQIRQRRATETPAP